MNNKSSLFRTVTALLSLLMIVSCFVALPAAASDLNEDVTQLENFSWMVDFSTMSSLTDNKGSKDYTLTATSAFKLATSPTDSTKKVMKVTNSTGNYRVMDTNDALVDYTSFTIEAEFYFEQLPTGTKGNDGVTTANEYPVSLLTWVTTSPSQFRSVRLDADGYICTSANATSRTALQIPLKEWFTLRLCLEPSSGLYNCTMITKDGEQSFTSSFADGAGATGSFVRIFDGYYKYTAYVSYVSVTTSSKPATITKEDSADYYGYQAKAVKNNKFDIRLLASLSKESFAATRAIKSDRFIEAGFEVTAIWEEDSEIRSSTQRVATSTVYSSIVADGETYTLPNDDYIVPLVVKDVDATLSHVEFVVMPYTILINGEKLYGDRMVLTWEGKLDSQKRPVFTATENTSLYTLQPSDDTFVGFQKSVGTAGRDESTPNGNMNELYIKNQKGESATDRMAYMKFTFSDAGIDRLENATQIYLRMYCGASPTEKELTAEEIAAGGASIAIYGTTTNWDEDTLDSTNYKNVEVVDVVTPGEVFTKLEWITIDVTDYVKEHYQDGAISFMIEKVGESGMSTTPYFRSKEHLHYEPHLVVYPTLYNHQTTLDKINNVGYEPWSYAQMLVDEWVNEGYKNAYTAGDIQWHVDFGELNGNKVNNNLGKPYTLSSVTAPKLTTSPTNENETVLGWNNTSGQYSVIDTNNLLANYKTFSVEADFYFEQFPYGGKTTTDATTAATYSLNLMRWMPTSGVTDTGIRINDRGELCTTTNAATSGTGVYVPLREWFNIRLDVDCNAGAMTVYLDNEQVCVIKKSSLKTVNASKVYILDGYFKYTAYLKDVRVYNGSFTVYDINYPDLSTPTGAYTIYTPYRYNRMVNSVQTQVYLRSIETLSKNAGYNAAAAVTPKYDQYGGVTNAGFKGNVTGYFHTESIGGRTFIIDPLGYPYFAVGMNTVEVGATATQKAVTLEKYGSAENFYDEISDTFRDIGINTAWGGDWQGLIETDQLGVIVGIPGISRYMSHLKLTDPIGAQKFIYNDTMNVFDPDFESFLNTQVKATIGAYATDPRILGYTSDNEISAQQTLLYDYLTIDPSDPRNAFSYATAWTFLIARTGKANPSVYDVTPALSDEFKCFVYDRYYQVVTGALEYAGAKQMYLGNRIHSYNRDSEGYLRAASQYVDVLTVNLYGGPQPPLDIIQQMYRYSGRPFIVTEFYAKAIKTTDMNGIPLMNQRNAGWIVESQEVRGIHYENYVLMLLESHCCVGWTWYRFRDNDQRVYKDSNGNIYVDYDIAEGDVTSFIKVGTLNADGTYNLDQSMFDMIEKIDLSVAGDPFKPYVSNITIDKLEIIYSGEHGGDESNNGSNKGLFDNHMNIYQPLADAFARVDKHIMNLVKYFDSLYAN